eukprot:Colp12_sorted_trinity150504_noHs@22450
MFQKLKGPSWRGFFALLCSLGIFSYAGSYIRYFLGQVSPYIDFPFGGTILAQVLGSFILGVFSSKQKEYVAYGYELFYVGICTGLCGSITTFSSWQYQSATYILRYPNSHSISTAPISSLASFRILSWLTNLAVTLALSVTSVLVGQHFGEAVYDAITCVPCKSAEENSYRKEKDPEHNELGAPCTHEDAQTSSPNGKNQADITLHVQLPADGKPDMASFRQRRCETALLLAFPMATAIIFSLTGVYDTERHALLVAVFAPFGAILRWVLGKYLNDAADHKWHGTLAANMLGTGILGIFTVIRTNNNCWTGDLWASAVFEGVLTGFCGDLSTVSTFASEITKTPVKKAWKYVLISLFGGQLLMVLTLGVMVWSKDNLPAC